MQSLEQDGGSGTTGVWASELLGEMTGMTAGGSGDAVTRSADLPFNQASSRLRGYHTKPTINKKAAPSSASAEPKAESPAPGPM
jgi:hypothetical protein